MSSLKPIKLWGQHGPNPPKIAVLLKELNLPHEIINIPFSDIKKPDYLSINPNGRIPAIEDPNTGLTLWESGAIIEYLIERYDTAQKLSFPAGSNESYLAKQWLYFQVSGQGPYYGQYAWFKKYHPEQVPSAVERYAKEINRVTGVLEGHLRKQKEAFPAAADGPWLVGGRISFADLAFVPWQTITEMFMEKGEYDPAAYPLVKAWVTRMAERESSKAVKEESGR